MTELELIIENTRLKFTEVLLEESEGTKEGARYQRMINEASNVIKKTLTGGLLEEAKEMYSARASELLTENMAQNVRERFRTFLSHPGKAAGAAGVAGIGAGVGGTMLVDKYGNPVAEVAPEVTPESAPAA